MGITHFEEAPAHTYDLGHLRGRWTMLGEAAGSETVGVRRITLPAGGWSTPAHEHGRSEEIFYVLAGSGISWQRGKAAPIRAGDCIVYQPRRGPHSVMADEHLDVLAFGMREYDESVRFAQLDISLVGNRAVTSTPGAVDGAPVQFVREAECGPPPLPAQPGERPPTIVNLDDVEPVEIRRPRVSRFRRNLGRAAGSRLTGLQHVVIAPGHHATAAHCHSLEEEIFVILDGSGTLTLGEQETPVRAGHVISRPAGTGVAHDFQADSELTMLAYGTRNPGDVCFYPRSGKIAFRGVGVMARIERLTDYWDGED
ncbi:MAG: cupin domain-containing protein [Solirubrobacteraceae bacterium]